MILYAGSYTQIVSGDLKGHGDGIYCFDFDEQKGQLTLKYTEKNKNTSYLAFSDKVDFLYSFQELDVIEKPNILAYRINEDFTLELASHHAIPGGFPCHLTYLKDENSVVVACYQTGNIVVYDLDVNGHIHGLGEVIQHNGTSVNLLRQESPHTHMVYANESKKEVYIPDLGIDKLMVYKYSREKGKLKFRLSQSLRMPEGTGPRHIVMHPSGNFAFVINELTATVCLIKLDKSGWSILQEVSSLPSDYKKEPSAAAIKISPDGKFIYVSNRGCNSIAIFKFEHTKECITLISNQESYGNTPRDFEISPDGTWLLVANQDSDNIIVFKRDENTGLLQKVSTNKQVNSVVCLKFMESKR